jgi:transposase
MVLIMFVIWMLLSAVGVRPRRDFDALEDRRLQAAELFARGASQADVARTLLVSRQSVSRWHAEWAARGAEGLNKAGRAGRRPMLDKVELSKVATELERGALANGYPTDLWTLARVAEVIEKVTGVTYHPGHVWKVLRTQLGWSRQRPARRARERDDEAIARWAKEEWPRIKKGLDAAKPGSASKTSRGSASSPR